MNAHLALVVATWMGALLTSVLLGWALTVLVLHLARVPAPVVSPGSVQRGVPGSSSRPTTRAGNPRYAT